MNRTKAKLTTVGHSYIHHLTRFYATIKIFPIRYDDKNSHPIKLFHSNFFCRFQNQLSFVFMKTFITTKNVSDIDLEL